jgi:ornithine cyclodeaminase/alanine dehydrogenase
LDEAQNQPRTRVQTDQAMLHCLSAASKTLGYLGYKAYVTSKKGSHFHVGLYDDRTGTHVALIQADYLGQMRTGAASGIATRLMARPEACEVGLFGSGKQARTQLLAVSKVRKLSRVQVYSPHEEHRKQFALKMSQQCQVEIEPVPRPEMAAEDKDIIITATTSREPVLNGQWLAEGTHLNVIGSNFITKAEVDVATIRRCDIIIVDSKDQARLEAGDFVAALEDGSIHWSDLHELAQVLVGRFSGREREQDITMFKSLGLGIEDVATAARVYERAREAGLGKEVPWS